ncbi:MAG: ABC transporter substrate-binding protein [Clostridiales bacterium]|jgi:branched-chain amino acid transport system substrate-binding protein|nr:ABC transporter substrate-binding protein [Clostridiales bacterium]
MFFKKLISFLVAGVMVLSLASCGGGTEPGNTEEPSGDSGSEEIVIGFVGPLTGPVSIYGLAASEGAQLYFEQNPTILGKTVRLELLDDKHDTSEAVTAYNRLVGNMGATAIIGAVTSKPAIALSIEAAKKGTPVITPTGTAAEITTYGENIFRACFLDPYQGQTMADFAYDSLGNKNIAILFDSADDYSSGVAEAFEAAFTAKGGTIVANEAYTSGDTDFNAQLTKIKNENPDALFLPIYYSDVAMISTQAKAMGFSTQLLGIDGWDGVIDILDDVSAVEGAYFCNHYSTEDTSEEVQNFVTSYEEKYGSLPNSFAALGFDTAHVIADAIERAGSGDSAAIVEAIKTTELPVVTSKSPLKFDEGGDPIKGISIIKIVDGKHTLDTQSNPE